VATKLKAKREETKQLNSLLKMQEEEILVTMQQKQIPKCYSMGHTFTVKERQRKPSATAKNCLRQVQEYFKLSEQQMNQFRRYVDEIRNEHVKRDTVLECKETKNKDSSSSSESTGTLPTAGGGDTLSTAIEDMYGA
jgi:hypothetical protein